MADYTQEMNALQELMKQEEAKEAAERTNVTEGSQIANMLTPITKRSQGAADILMNYKPMDRSAEMNLAWSGGAASRQGDALARQKSLMDRYKTTAGLEESSQKLKQQKELADRTIALKDKELAMKAGKDKNGKPLTAAQVLTVNEGNTIPTTLERVKISIDKNKDLFGPVKGRLSSFNPYDTRTQVFDAEMRAASQQFGRYMEGGVLRKEDEAKYKKMFPGVGDTKKVAEGKLNIVNNMLREKQKSDLEALKKQGYDLTGLELPEQKEVQNVADNVENDSMFNLMNEAGASDGLENLTDEALDQMLGL